VYRYLALIWNPASSEASSTARTRVERTRTALGGWRVVLDTPGAVAFCWGEDGTGAQTRSLDRSSGVVFGTIFNRNIETVETAQRVVFDTAESDAIVASGGTRLFERYWGRYVALVHDARTGETAVLRDPMGQLPCYLTVQEGVSIVFSDLEDCLKLSVASFSIDWDYITGLIAYPMMMSGETALNEVAEVQSGERIRFTGGGLRRTIEWHPFDIARTDPILDTQRATAELRATVRSCVHAWAARYRGLIHNLSGGLDSSIVLSCLMDAPTRPSITCLNYYGTGPGEDERVHAQRVAAHLGAELVEYLLDPADLRIEQIANARRSPRPWFYMYDLEHGSVEEGLAAQRGANGLFTGAGGDGIFFQARAELAVADYLFDHGPGAGLMRTAVDAAQVERKSVWPLIFKALKSRFSRSWNPTMGANRPERTLVGEPVMRIVARDGGFRHPWFTPEATRGVPPGILWHVASVATPPAYYSTFGPESSPERTLPIMSQPLIELCLRMPTYMLIRSGTDRAVARRAFAPDLPPETIRRIGKGRIDHHLRNVLDANLGFVREYLLDGVLVKRGLLDRKNLERYLTRDSSPADYQYTEILQEHLCVEAWVRRAADLPKPT
jgi:asparagine synthase (glutamine-hydrolysing)